MTSLPSHPGDRAPFLGDALIGSAGRFQDPVAFVFTVLDYLVIGLGGYGAITAQLDYSTGNTAPWTVSTFPPELLGQPATESVAIGGVKFSIHSATGLPIDEPYANLEALKKWILDNDPGFADAMTRRFTAASKDWADSHLPYHAFSWSDRAPQATKSIAETLERAVRKLNGEGPLAGAAELHLALAFGTDAQGIGIWTAEKHGPPRDQPALREAILRACATGFAQWSAATEPPWLAVPCVVGGFPWAVIYSEVAPPAWMHGYRLYRDVLPRLLENTRTQARNAFLAALIGVTDEALSEENPRIGELRRRWTTLSMSFPFSLPRLPDDLETESEDPLLFITRLQEAAESMQPVGNVHFPVAVATATRQSWGDIADLETVLRSAIGSRVRVAGMAKSNLAQAISHEFKNLTANIAVVGSDLERLARRPAEGTRVAELAKVLGIQALQLNGVSLALYSLTTLGAGDCFEPSVDAVYLLRAAVRIALEFRAITQPGFVVDDSVTFQECVELLSATYLPVERRSRQQRTKDVLSTLAEFVNETPVAFLLAAAAEPVRNVRIQEPLHEGDQPIHVWTAVDFDNACILLRQRTVEAVQTPRSAFPSKGALLANRLFPATFCRIDPLVRPIGQVSNFQPAEGGGVLVERETMIRVFGRPIPGELR